MNTISICCKIITFTNCFKTTLLYLSCSI